VWRLGGFVSKQTGAIGFHEALAVLMAEREISGKALARKVPCDPALLSRYVNGKQEPSRRIAGLLDKALDAEGRLVALVPRRVPGRAISEVRTNDLSTPLGEIAASPVLEPEIRGTARRVPNLILRRIREQERNETRSEFAEALAETAHEIGEPVEPSERYVARLEDGDIRYPHPPYRRALVKLCERSMSELGFTRGHISSNAHDGETAEPSAGENYMSAETPHLPIPAEPETSFPLSLSAISGEPAPSANDIQTIAFVSEALSCYARTANMLGSGRLTDIAERNLRLVYSGYGQVRGDHRRRLLITCARYAEFLGWLHQDLGNPMISLFWMDRALEWAQEANTDPQFTSYVLMRKSDHAEQYGTADRVIALAEASLRIPSLSPRAKALAIQQEARGYSQRGDKALFERKLDEARESIIQAEGSGDAPWGEYCDLTYITMQEASGRIELGQFNRAIDIMERELPAMASTDRVDSTVFRARLARAYAEGGYLDRAAEAALAACVDTRNIASIRAFTELSRVRLVLGSHDASHPAIVTFISAFESLAIEFPTRTRKAQ
jgi:transcriptional regulator with XRE-family HTH domain